jgi:hypothetical protein
MSLTRTCWVDWDKLINHYFSKIFDFGWTGTVQWIISFKTSGMALELDSRFLHTSEI